jgi:hypothetical protein
MLFKRDPFILICSEEKIRAGVDFLEDIPTGSSYYVRFRMSCYPVTFLERKRLSIKKKRKEDEGTEVGKITCRATIADGRLRYPS